MALIKCVECGREISDKAAACIHCGCPVTVSTGGNESTASANRQTNGTGKNIDFGELFGEYFGGGAQNIPTVTVEAKLVGPQTASTTEAVFVPEFNQTVKVNIPNSVAAGQSLMISAGINSALNGINKPMKVVVAKVSHMETPVIREATGSTDMEMEQKIKALKRCIYIKPVISLIFSVYFILSFAGLFLMMYLFPDGGAPNFLMNVIGIGFSVGFIPVFYFKFLPYIIGNYPDPGFFKTRKMMRSLERRDLLKKAVMEMETCEPVPFGDKMCLSNNFLFPKKKNGVIIPCDELLWVYGSFSNKKGKGYLMTGTKQWGIQCFSHIKGRKRYEQIAPAACRVLQKRNPAILVGETQENKKAYFARVKNKR